MLGKRVKRFWDLNEFPDLLGLACIEFLWTINGDYVIRMTVSRVYETLLIVLWFNGNGIGFRCILWRVLWGNLLNWFLWILFTNIKYIKRLFKCKYTNLQMKTNNCCPQGSNVHFMTKYFIVGHCTVHHWTVDLNSIRWGPRSRQVDAVVDDDSCLESATIWHDLGLKHFANRRMQRWQRSARENQGKEYKNGQISQHRRWPIREMATSVERRKPVPTKGKFVLSDQYQLHNVGAFQN